MIKNNIYIVSLIHVDVFQQIETNHDCVDLQVQFRNYHYPKDKFNFNFVLKFLPALYE